MFTALYRFYTTSFWGVGIHVGPNHHIYSKGFRTNLLKLPIHLQEKNFEKIWNNGEGFNGIIINNGYPRLRVDLWFMFLLYSQHKAENFPANKFGYGCWNGGTFTKSEARFYYGPFDPCTSVKIPDFSDSSFKGKEFVNFNNLCLNGRKRFVRSNK